MNILNDLIYFTSLEEEGNQLIQAMYRADKPTFLDHLNQLFDIEFRNNIFAIVGEPLISNAEHVQLEIDNIWTEVACHLHSSLSESGRSYWKTRGVTENQIDQFKLGDNFLWLPTGESNSIAIQDIEFFKSLAKKYRPKYVYQVLRSMIDQIRTAQKLYGNGRAVSCPTFDSSGLCRGIVFRILHYEKRAEFGFKNMYKFYNPFSWSYVFNFETVEKYDELIMVEGVLDAMALMRAGYLNVISPSMVRLSPYHVRLLQNKKLHILFDQDRGGLEGLRFIKDKFENSENLLTLALCPTPRDFDEMEIEEIHQYMNTVSDYDVRNLTSAPVSKHSIALPHSEGGIDV